MKPHTMLRAACTGLAVVLKARTPSGGHVSPTPGIPRSRHGMVISVGSFDHRVLAPDSSSGFPAPSRAARRNIADLGSCGPLVGLSREDAGDRIHRDHRLPDYCSAQFARNVPRNRWSASHRLTESHVVAQVESLHSGCASPGRSRSACGASTRRAAALEAGPWASSAARSCKQMAQLCAADGSLPRQQPNVQIGGSGRFLPGLGPITQRERMR